MAIKQVWQCKGKARYGGMCNNTYKSPIKVAEVTCLKCGKKMTLKEEG